MWNYDKAESEKLWHTFRALNIFYNSLKRMVRLMDFNSLEFNGTYLNSIVLRNDRNTHTSTVSIRTYYVHRGSAEETGNP